MSVRMDELHAIIKKNHLYNQKQEALSLQHKLNEITTTEYLDKSNQLSAEKEGVTLEEYTERKREEKLLVAKMTSKEKEKHKRDVMARASGFRDENEENRYKYYCKQIKGSCSIKDFRENCDK